MSTKIYTRSQSQRLETDFCLQLILIASYIIFFFFFSFFPIILKAMKWYIINLFALHAALIVASPTLGRSINFRDNHGATSAHDKRGICIDYLNAVRLDNCCCACASAKA
jgi:hypothetical protein